MDGARPRHRGARRGRLPTLESGYLWFFNPDNLELLVKVLDGRPVNGHFWIFSGALTNVVYSLVVRDTVTSEERRFDNAGGFHSFVETDAF